MYKYLLIGTLLGLTTPTFSAAEDDSLREKKALVRTHFELSDGVHDGGELLEAALGPSLQRYQPSFLDDLLRRLAPLMPDDNLSLATQIFDVGAIWLSGPGKGTVKDSAADLLGTAANAQLAWPSSEFMWHLNQHLAATSK